MMSWRPADRPLQRPRAAEIDIWSIDLESPPIPIPQLWQLLSAEERKRAERFHFERHRRRFTVRRGAMRLLLGAYLDRQPECLAFVLGPKGKPGLENDTKDSSDRLVFNLSDSADFALLAVGEGVELGVDVESLERPRDAGRLVERFFSEEERQVYQALPEQQKTAGFFRAWTSKEAYLKAIGTGLTVPLRHSTVELDPRRPARIWQIGESREAALDWSLYAFCPAEGFTAALAIPRDGNSLRTYRWAQSSRPGPKRSKPTS